MNKNNCTQVVEVPVHPLYFLRVRYEASARGVARLESRLDEGGLTSAEEYEARLWISRVNFYRYVNGY